MKVKMQHRKQYHCLHFRTPNGEDLLVEGPVPPETVARYPLHPECDAFRTPEKQHEALMEIAGFEEARIILAHNETTTVGYVTFLHPDPLESWSDEQMEELLELGAIEIAPDYRHGGLAKTLLKVAFMDPNMENYIVFTTEYCWHWDLKRTGLSVWEYRDVMEKVMKSAGLIWMPTDDPEICAHPANALMVRIGKNVSPCSVEAFDRLRLRRRHLY